MREDLRGFWHRFQKGIEVAVVSSTPDQLLGVRDGILRYFQEGLERSIPIAVVAHPPEEARGGLALSDEATVQRARQAARRLQQQLGEAYHFYVCSEGGLHSLELGDEMHYFVRSWTVIVSAAGEACGSSGSVEIPGRLVAGLARDEIAIAVPATRRRGGMIASLTGGIESRRSAVATSTLHALASLFYGVLGRDAGRAAAH